MFIIEHGLIGGTLHGWLALWRWPRYFWHFVIAGLFFGMLPDLIYGLWYLFGHGYTLYVWTHIYTHSEGFGTQWFPWLMCLVPAWLSHQIVDIFWHMGGENWWPRMWPWNALVDALTILSWYFMVRRYATVLHR